MKEQRQLLDDAQIRQWVKACDPREPLERTDNRYVDLSEGPFAVRGSFELSLLLEPLRWSDNTTQLFSGFSGTGKSTELRRLMALLEADNYAVLLIDAKDYHSLDHPLAIEDLLVLLAASIGDATAKHFGEDPGPGFWRRLVDWLKQSGSGEPRLEDISLDVGPANLQWNLAYEKPLWLRIREFLTSRVQELAAQVRAHIAVQVGRLRQGRRGVVILVDSFDRLRGQLEQFRVVMESVVEVLGHSELLRFENCHLILTVPPYVPILSPALTGLYDGTSVLLPAVKVAEPRSGVPYPTGIRALREVLARRVDLAVIFGGREELIERCILATGGHVRQLITLMRNLLIYYVGRFGVPLRAEDIEGVLAPQAEAMRNSLFEKVLLLDKFQRSGRIEELNEDELPLLANLMDEHQVLCYRNGAGFFEVHPLIREHVIQEAARRRGELEVEAPPPRKKAAAKKGE